MDPSKAAKYLEWQPEVDLASGLTMPYLRCVQRFHKHNDLAPTVADIVGATLPLADGRSLAPLLRGEEVAWRGAFLVELAPNFKLERPALRAVRTDRYLYVEYRDGETELYDVWQDR